MQYFAGRALQQHGTLPVLGWPSGTPEQRLRSQPRLQVHANSSRYKVNHQAAQQQPQHAVPQADGGAAAYIFGPEVAATPVASTPDIKQRLFHDTAAAAAGSRFSVCSRAQLSSTGAAPADSSHPATGGRLAHSDTQHLGGTFVAALGEEASGLGLGFRHSPAGLAGAAAVAAAAAADNGLAPAVANNPLLLASIAAPSSAADVERLQREVAALQHKFQKKQQHVEVRTIGCTVAVSVVLLMSSEEPHR